MSRIEDMASVNGSRRYSRDLLEHPGQVLTEPWWVMPGLDQGESSFAPWQWILAASQIAECEEALRKEI